MGLKKIVLVTTGQPATNPRIVKEADALQAHGFEVTVLYSFFIDWAAVADKRLLAEVKWKYLLCGGTPSKNKVRFIYTRIRFKLSRILNRFIGNNFGIAERAQARAFDELLGKAKQIKADWYIGHNLGALAIAVKAAEFNGGKSGFDFEDYHRGENCEVTKYDLSRIIFLENKYVPRLGYVSAASPLIAKKIAEHFPLQEDNVITLLNCFPLKHQPVFRKKLPTDNTLQLFWFSQTIGMGRGLEMLIQALVEMNDPTIHLTLAGKCAEPFQQYLATHAHAVQEQIHLVGIISPEKLPEYASNFDVGLAIELTVPENRDICLTNKVFTYLLAGNAILLSESKMQKIFNERFNVGISFPVDEIDMLIEKIKAYKNLPFLEHQRSVNYNLGKNHFNWENEFSTWLTRMKLT